MVCTLPLKSRPQPGMDSQLSVCWLACHCQSCCDGDFQRKSAAAYGLVFTQIHKENYFLIKQGALNSSKFSELLRRPARSLNNTNISFYYDYLQEYGQPIIWPVLLHCRVLHVCRERMCTPHHASICRHCPNTRSVTAEILSYTVLYPSKPRSSGGSSKGHKQYRTTSTKSIGMPLMCFKTMILVK